MTEPAAHDPDGVPAVSVIVPCYNGGPFLDGLAACLSAQTFRDFEVIIVDDGSTDEGTRQKLAALRRTAQVIHQANAGPAAARNVGIARARGAFVLPLDCDDTIEPTFIVETLAALRAAPKDVGFVFTHIRLAGVLEGVLACHQNRFDQLFLNQLPYCMLLRRSVYDTVGGYDELMFGNEDWEFGIRLGKAGIRGLELARPLFVYRISPTGLMLGLASRVHGTRWRYIRRKHSDLYRLPALIAAWRAARAEPRRISPLTAAGLMGLAHLLPERWFNYLFHRAVMAGRALRAGRGEFRIVESK